MKKFVFNVEDVNFLLAGECVVNWELENFLLLSKGISTIINSSISNILDSGLSHEYDQDSFAYLSYLKHQLDNFCLDALSGKEIESSIFSINNLNKKSILKSPCSLSMEMGDIARFVKGVSVALGFATYEICEGEIKKNPEKESLIFLSNFKKDLDWFCIDVLSGDYKKYFNENK